MTGPARKLCGAALRTRPGATCTNPPMRDATRCRMHGGASPKAKAAAAVRRQRAELAHLAVTYGLPVEIDPTDALLGELARTHGIVLWLEQQVRGLGADEVVWSQLEETVDDVGAGEFTGTNTGKKSGAAPHVLVQLYGLERDRLVKIAAECKKAGVEQAVQDRTKALAAEFMARLELVVRALGHSPADPATLRVIAGALRGPAAAIEGEVAR